ncbi:protein JINGUBANG-like [Andrographis paniculata]|uniref:protein JINGUBANG-like n=1 Tax=Andrographis paniculata TaxID=175694 RepID=UPI0021E8EEAF|nr:protein JINGUBANG-like [Andrographis paniculata]
MDSFDRERFDKSLPRGFSFDDDDDDNDEDSRIASARISCLSAASWRHSPIGVSAVAAAVASPSRTLAYHCVVSLHHSEGDIHSITVTKDFIFTGSSSDKIRVWRQPDCAEMSRMKCARGEIRAILANGRLLFTTHGDRRVRVWEFSGFPMKKSMTLPKKRSFFFGYNKNNNNNKNNNDRHRDSISCLAYNNNEKLLFTGSWDRTIRVWRITEKRCIDSFVAHEGRVTAIAIDEDNGSVFTCSSDGTVKVWRRLTKESCHILTMVLKFHHSSINALALSRASNVCFLYSGSSDGLINFWAKESNSGRYNHGGFLQGHHFAILCLDTTDDLILSGSEDATIRIWRRDNSQSCHTSLAVIDGHHGPVKCLAAARQNVERNDENEILLVYSASLDRTLKVWRVRVMHDVEKANWEGSKDRDDLFDNTTVDISPVLSPSWVQKKIQVS